MEEVRVFSPGLFFVIGLFDCEQEMRLSNPGCAADDESRMKYNACSCFFGILDLINQLLERNGTHLKSILRYRSQWGKIYTAQGNIVKSDNGKLFGDAKAFVLKTSDKTEGGKVIDTYVTKRNTIS